VLIAAGIGITPLLAMLKAHADRGPTAPPLYLVHCVRDGAHHPLRSEIEAAVAERPDFRVHYVYSAPRDKDRRGVDYHQSGRFTADDLYQLLADNHLIHRGRRIELPWFESDIYLCGPAAFQDGLRRTLIAAGAPADRVFFEHFDVAFGESRGAVVEQARVSFARSGIDALWHDIEALSLLELAERAGLAPESGCRMGICQSCQCRLVEGEVHYDSAPTNLPAADVVLTCIAKPGSPRVVLDL
jgi:ferredoxin-NADP reductase